MVDLGGWRRLIDQYFLEEGFRMVRNNRMIKRAISSAFYSVNTGQRKWYKPRKELKVRWREM